MQEKQAPIARANELAQPQSHPIRVIQRKLDVLQYLGSCPFNLFFGRRRRANPFDRLDEGVACRVKRIALTNLGSEDRKRRVMPLKVEAEDRTSLLRLNQPFVQQTRG